MRMDMYVALHEADASGPFGPMVSGTWSWTDDRTQLTFVPDMPFASATSHTIHIGGGMRDANGNMVNLERNGHGMGGEWVTQQMMQGCTMQVCGAMMGTGWQHSNGSFGMSFTFMTRPATALLEVIPAGGETGVDPNAPITLTFDHVMHMDMYVAFHEGADVSGPEVDGAWAWSGDRTQLTFTPASPLNPQTQYTVHIGGGMKDANGHIVNLGHHGQTMGGQWVSEQMMNDRMNHLGNMMGQDDMMGEGWRHANGTYGMIFTFTTA
jgi:hypothetical protein